MTDHPVVVPISKWENLSKTTSLDTIQNALEAFHRDGLVILKDCVSLESLDHLYGTMTNDLEHLLATLGFPLMLIYQFYYILNFCHGRLYQDASLQHVDAPQIVR